MITSYFLNAFCTLGVSGFKLLVSIVAGAGMDGAVSGPVPDSLPELLHALNKIKIARVNISLFILELLGIQSIEKRCI